MLLLILLLFPPPSPYTPPPPAPGVATVDYLLGNNVVHAQGRLPSCRFCVAVAQTELRREPSYATPDVGHPCFCASCWFSGLRTGGWW